jgi:hypothetical protein
MEHIPSLPRFLMKATFRGREPMHHFLIIAALLIVPAYFSPAFAQGANPGPSRTVADPIPAKPPLTLTDEQRQRVVQAIKGSDTLDKLPEGFTPAIGAKVPPQEKLAAHPLPRPLIYEIPALQQYYYAQLADSVLIIDPMTNEVVDIAKR